MNKIINRLKEMRREETGFTMVEIIVATLLLIPIIAVLMPIVGLTKTGGTFIDKTLGINQGSVGDISTEIYEAGGEFLRDNPDTHPTKQELIDGGYVSVPDHIIWNINYKAYGHADPELCVIAYSSEQQTNKYNALLPAETSVRGLGTATVSHCWFWNEAGDFVPNWEMVEQPRTSSATANSEAETQLVQASSVSSINTVPMAQASAVSNSYGTQSKATKGNNRKVAPNTKKPAHPHSQLALGGSPNA